MYVIWRVGLVVIHFRDRLWSTNKGLHFLLKRCMELRTLVDNILFLRIKPQIGGY